MILLCALSPGVPTARAQRAAEADEQSLVVETNLTNVAVTVADAQGRTQSTLDRSAFAVFDNGQRQEITFFAADDAPASVVVLFDLSGSITPRKMGQARESLRRFFENSHPQDEFFLIGFNQGAEVLSRRAADADTLLNKLSYQEARGQTALFDACRLALKQLGRGAHPKRAILLISDGQDNYSRSTLGGLRRELKEEDVLIYAIGINDRVDNATVLGRAGRNTLDEIASITGGRAFFTHTPEELDEACEQVALELRSQYQIAYRPSPFAQDGKWHRVKVTVTSPAGGARLFLRYKGGYYARPRRATVSLPES